jgi:hypothetical protein
MYKLFKDRANIELILGSPIVRIGQSSVFYLRKVREPAEKIRYVNAYAGRSPGAARKGEIDEKLVGLSPITFYPDPAVTSLFPMRGNPFSAVIILPGVITIVVLVIVRNRRIGILLLSLRLIIEWGCLLVRLVRQVRLLLLIRRRRLLLTRVLVIWITGVRIRIGVRVVRVRVRIVIIIGSAKCKSKAYSGTVIIGVPVVITSIMVAPIMIPTIVVSTGAIVISAAMVGASSAITDATAMIATSMITGSMVTSPAASSRMTMLGFSAPSHSG